jgi:hypothetical protein
MIRALTLLLALLLPTLAAAESYQVDLIVFLQGGAEGESPLPQQIVDTSHAIEPEHVEALHAAGIRILPESSGGFADLLHSLELSGHRYEPIEHLSWVQDNPPDGRGPTLHLTGGNVVDTPGGPVRALDGTVSLHGGFYLHLDADLVWTQHQADGTVTGWRLNENRRLRLNEIHYLDNARLGVITRVTRRGD